METNSFNFIALKLNESIANNDRKGYKAIVYLIKSLNDSLLIDVLNNINSSNIDEDFIHKCFEETTLEKKVIISGLVLLSKTENKSLEFKKDWDTIYSEVLEQMKYETEEMPKNYMVLSKYMREKKTNFYHYACASISENKRENCFTMLKGWSSSTPLINSPNFRNQKFGGGFFFRYNGLGFAVDPGCNFVENMHEQGIYISDIDYVIITHSHIDHNHDMETLATMNYEYNKIIGNRSFSKFKHLKKHKIKWYVDSTTFNKVKSNEDIENIYPTQHHIFNEMELPQNLNAFRIIADTPIKTIREETATTIVEISYFPTVHNCKGSFGFKITLTDKSGSANKVTVGYTSDTAYFDKLSSKLDGCDILISNVSELSENDLLKKTVQSDTHLRLQGCINLVKQMNTMPKLYIISEFWGGKDDIRLYIVKTITDKINNTEFKPEHPQTMPAILGGDVGLTVNLDNMFSKCSFCNGYSPTDSMHTILIGQYERLKYVCDNCCAHT